MRTKERNPPAFRNRRRRKIASGATRRFVILTPAQLAAFKALGAIGPDGRPNDTPLGQMLDGCGVMSAAKHPCSWAVEEIRETEDGPIVSHPPCYAETSNPCGIEGCFVCTEGHEHHSYTGCRLSDAFARNYDDGREESGGAERWGEVRR